MEVLEHAHEFEICAFFFSLQYLSLGIQTSIGNLDGQSLPLRAITALPCFDALANCPNLIYHTGQRSERSELHLFSWAPAMKKIFSFLFSVQLQQNIDW